ncbi:MAG: IS66 family insertion sequence element accessory protein TnpB [Novosphingobium sp.]|jgi:transposase|nr:IS66 family insertion sequence element accessory protein TnpB [Novosphingobium sp.]
MIALRYDVRVLVATQPIDFRCGINRLVALTAQTLGADPYSGDVFVFRSKRRDRLKLLHWDGSGMILATKWLEAGGFYWPPVRDGVLRLGGAEYAALLAGLEWSRLMPKPIRKPLLTG